MPPVKKARPTPAGAKAAAARAERNGGAKSCTWRGLKLTLPAKLPATVGFDLVEIQETQNLITVLRFIRGMVGDQGFAKIRAKVAKDNTTDTDEIATELLDVIFAEYGMSLGE